MNNLTLFLLGLVLINVPSCFSECFSELLTPAYPCCKGSRVVYTDDNGDWGVENNKWCGIGEGPFEPLDDSCFSVPYGYKCCEKCKVVFTDDLGDWGVEKNRWCGIKYSCASPVEVETTVPVEIEETTIPVEVETTVPVEIEETLPGIQDFDFTFLKMENNKVNMLYSPLSIKYALKMLEEGAAGKTLTEIKSIIGNSTLSKYESIDKILSLANGLFIKDDYYENVKEEYLDTLKEKYDAEVKEDEFKSAKNANEWIEDKTLNIIKKMLKDETVQNSVMLLINALAIDMEWADPFSYQTTDGEKFYLDNGEVMEATTMYNKYYEKLSYYKDDDLLAVTLDLKDYKKTQFEFMAIMPNENLSGYVENVTKEKIDEIDEKLIPASDVNDGVTLEIPKFKFSYDLALKDDLMNLGIKDAFDKFEADFTKMANPVDPSKKLYVSDALHKADIDFSEDGVKAAAVTVFVMGLGAAGPLPPTYPVHLYINKPFMFIIRDKNTKDIWFTGTVYKPNSWADDKKEYNPRRDDYEFPCFSIPLGYSCCHSCDIIYSDFDGDWGIENDDWCGITYDCSY